MTKKTIPAAKVREARDLHRDAAKMVTITEAERVIHHHVADAMEALLPPPPPLALPDGWRLADHPDRGRVIVTTENPDRHGYVAFTYRANYLNSGRGNDWCKHDELTYIDQETATPEAVPPNTLTEGSEWDSVDALARACDESGRDQIVVADKDGEVFVWGADAEWWETGLPGCDYAPHKILHTGRKADW